MTQPITDAAKKAAETIHRDRYMLVMSETVGIIQSAIDTATTDLRAENARLREALEKIIEAYDDSDVPDSSDGERLIAVGCEIDPARAALTGGKK